MVTRVSVKSAAGMISVLRRTRRDAGIRFLERLLGVRVGRRSHRSVLGLLVLIDLVEQLLLALELGLDLLLEVVLLGERSVNLLVHALFAIGLVRRAGPYASPSATTAPSRTASRAGPWKGTFPVTAE